MSSLIVFLRLMVRVKKILRPWIAAFERFVGRHMVSALMRQLNRHQFKVNYATKG